VCTMNWQIEGPDGQRIEALTGPPLARKICLAWCSRGCRPVQDEVYATHGTVNAHIRGSSSLFGQEAS
jgi:hypothetical protein